MSKISKFGQERKIGRLRSEHFAAFSGPVTLNNIVFNLWLGNLTAATDLATITKYKITHILTIDVFPLPQKIIDTSKVTSKFIRMADEENENLLKHLDNTFNFIEKALNDGGIVLVHCFFGVSRSASIIIAYIMKKQKISYIEALMIVRSKRPKVHPNSGFEKQLIDYYQQDYNICINFV